MIPTQDPGQWPNKRKMVNILLTCIGILIVWIGLVLLMARPRNDKQPLPKGWLNDSIERVLNDTLQLRDSPKSSVITEWSGPPIGWKGAIYMDSAGNGRVEYHGKIIARIVRGTAVFIQDSAAVIKVIEAFKEEKQRKLLKQTNKI